MIIAAVLLIVMFIIVGCISIEMGLEVYDFMILSIACVFTWLFILIVSAPFFSEKTSSYDYYKISDNKYLKVENYHYNRYIFNDKKLVIKTPEDQEISKINKFEYVTRDDK